MEVYKYRTRHLLKMLIDVGFSKNMSSGVQKIFRLKNQGKFSPPLDPATGHAVFTEKQLVSIVKALSPGGSGEWHFR